MNLTMDNTKKTNSLFQRLFRRNSISKEDYEKIKDESTPPPVLKVRFVDSWKIVTVGMVVVVVFFGLGGLWVTFAKISGAIIAPGEIRVDTERKTVQHLEGGIIHEILVRNGDYVEVGQPLVLLDSPQTISATDQLLLQLGAIRIEAARLIAERDFLSAPEWPGNDDNIPPEKFSELLTTAQKVFNSGRLALKNQLGLLKQQISQLHEQINSIDDRLIAEQQVRETLQEELDAKLILFGKQYIDKTQILTLRRALAERQGTQAQLRGAQAEIREKVAEFDLRIDALKSEYRQKAIARLSDIQQIRFSLQQKLLPLEDARRRLRVTAPVSGQVVALQVHSNGGVLQPGQPLLDIVPADSPLIVVAHIKVSDITHIQLGQIADVQLSAFPTRTTPKITGEVVYISADRMMQRTAYGEQPSYIVHVELNKQELAENNLYLTAGMPAAVFVRTKSRTVLDYALEPLKQNFDRALRE